MNTKKEALNQISCQFPSCGKIATYKPLERMNPDKINKTIIDSYECANGHIMGQSNDTNYLKAYGDSGNGQLSFSKKLKDHLQDGVSEFYDFDGKLISKEF